MTRTCDLLVRSQTLYPTELRARFSSIYRIFLRSPNSSLAVVYAESWEYYVSAIATVSATAAYRSSRASISRASGTSEGWITVENHRLVGSHRRGRSGVVELSAAACWQPSRRQCDACNTGLYKFRRADYSRFGEHRSQEFSHRDRSLDARAGFGTGADLAGCCR